MNDLDFDKAHIWHPYSSMTKPLDMYQVAHADGVFLTLKDGTRLIDGMASWWSVIHGYNNPELNQAAHQQIDEFSHVMFGGLTHAPAIELAKKLIAITPDLLTKVFFADSGSVAVEVAIKMAIQYWHSQGQPRKNKLVSLMNGYHGDTFGAMAVTDPVNGMHHLFSDVLPKHYFAPSPQTRFGEELIKGDLAELESILQEHHETIAALILEPIVQGAGGMKFYSAEYLKEAYQLTRKYGVLLIADEIATGFARSGELFACNHAGISPDILCLGKAITGGYLSFAATLCTEKVALGISEGEAGVFMHGPTFMANPLACSIANKSIEILLSSDWKANILRIETSLRQGFSKLDHHPAVQETRVLGAIGVIEMKEPVNMSAIQPAFVKAGLWVRPFGKLVYVMPPYVISDNELDKLCSGITHVITSVYK